MITSFRWPVSSDQPRWMEAVTPSCSTAQARRTNSMSRPISVAMTTSTRTMGIISMTVRMTPSTPAAGT